jgi:hypothetical protein
MDTFWNLNLKSIQLLGHADLATKPGGVGQAIGKILKHLEL